MSALEHQDLEQLIAAHQARLKQLELTRARYGDDTAPQIHTEIERIKQKLIDLGVAVVDNTNRELYLLLTAHYQQLDARMYRFEHRLNIFEQQATTMLVLLNQVLARFTAPPQTKPRPARRVNGE